MLRIAVTDERGVSLPGVGVALVPAQGGDPRATTRRAATGPDGTVALPAAKGGVFELQTDRGTVRRFTATGHSMALDVRVTGGRELHGSVVDSAGAPVAGAAIWLATDDDPLAGTEVAMTGSAGTYALRGVPASVWIAARAPGLAAIAARRAVTPECTLQLTQPGGSIAGRVIDRTGAPVADALVVIGAGGEGVSARLGPDFVPEMPPPQTVRTDARGAFVASGVPMGTTPVVVRAVDHAPSCRQIVVAAGVTDAVFTLEPGVHLRGEVVDRSTGAPLAALVSCRSDDSFATGTAQCGADGRFEFASLPPGQLGLVAVTGDGASVDLALECAPGDRFVRIELEPRQWRDASIHTATGAVLAGWEVAAPRSAQMVPGTDTVPAVADEGGRLRIAVDAGAGWRHLLVRPPGSVPWLSAAGLTTSRTDGGWEVIVPDTAVPAARLAVVARDAGGVPAAGARVWLRAGGGPLLEVGVLDARGEIDIGPLPAGSYEVFTATVSPAMPPFDLPAVTLRAGEKRRFEYTSRHTARVEYAFTFADGSRPRAPRVQLMASIPGVARATARSCTGHFTTLPGCGVLTADGSDFVPVGDAQFEALPDSVVKVERIVRRAARRMLSLADLPEVGRGSSLKGRFCDVRTGEVLGCFEVPTKEAMLRPLHAVLPEGLFRLEAVSPDGVRLRAEFRCDGLEPEYSARRLIFAIDR